MAGVDKKFVEPVVLGNRPFKMVAEVAQEAVTQTHKLVVRLTKARVDSDTKADRMETKQAAGRSR
ncbi:hypothetical protein HJC10_16840 [Corallococcus exiguus]|nr:hypothetical protein [Corallococcus exiguus]